MARPKVYPTLLDRIEANTMRLPWSGCWIYLGTSTPAGYCKIGFYKKKKEGMVRVGAWVHRLAFKLLGNKLTKRDVLRHTCDNESCWNPAHLIPGSHKENIHDQKRNGRKINCKPDCYWCRKDRELDGRTRRT